MKLLQSVTDNILTRAGTAIGAIFLGYGISEPHVNVLVPAILVIAGVGLDIITTRVLGRR